MRYISALAVLVLSTAMTMASPTDSPVRSKLAHVLRADALAAGCKNSPMGGNCLSNAPCCSSAGYCGSDPSFCAEACNAAGSFAADSCWPLPMAKVFQDDFSNKSRLVDISQFNGFPDTADWVIDRSPTKLNHADITDDGFLRLKLNRIEKHPETGGGIGATVHQSRWLKYGTIEARLKTASNLPGPVSSFIMISPISGDEIDIEIVGKDPTDVLTNFYYKVSPGHPVDYQNGGHTMVNLDTTADFHIYKIEWTPEKMEWSFDGQVKRTTLVADAKGSFPDTPLRVAFGLWDGGYGNEGTAEWAGQNTSYAPNEQGEYQMLIDWVKITPMNPDNSTEPWPGSKYLGNGNGGGSTGNNGGNGGKGINGASALSKSIKTIGTVALVLLVGVLIA
ncbi:hypothetical protein BGZ83_001112 [Gryganskiella cystojenkinii]|nr:hypothetical protein BGZ83_001112 [Gryganskiella cystojenkinii]